MSKEKELFLLDLDLALCPSKQFTSNKQTDKKTLCPGVLKLSATEWQGQGLERGTHEIPKEQCFGS